MQSAVRKTKLGRATHTEPTHERDLLGRPLFFRRLVAISRPMRLLRGPALLVTQSLLMINVEPVFIDCGIDHGTCPERRLVLCNPRHDVAHQLIVDSERKVNDSD